MMTLPLVLANPFQSDLMNREAELRRPDLLNGEVLVQTQAHTAWGGAVSASLYLPQLRSRVWQQLTNYPRWVEYFPDLVHSEILQPLNSPNSDGKRLYQAAQKMFLFFSAQVEIYLQVFEHALGNACQQISFRLEKGNFQDFAADLTLQDWGNGTLLTYAVQATPTLPVPSIVIEQAMRFELPANMRVMRQVLNAS
jgi:hypothetical protein